MIANLKLLATGKSNDTVDDSNHNEKKQKDDDDEELLDESIFWTDDLQILDSLLDSAAINQLAKDRIHEVITKYEHQSEGKGILMIVVTFLKQCLRKCKCSVDEHRKKLDKNLENIEYIQGTMINDLDKWLEERILSILTDRDTVIADMKEYCHLVILTKIFDVNVSQDQQTKDAKNKNDTNMLAVKNTYLDDDIDSSDSNSNNNSNSNDKKKEKNKPKKALNPEHQPFIDLLFWLGMGRLQEYIMTTDCFCDQFLDWLFYAIERNGKYTRRKKLTPQSKATIVVIMVEQINQCANIWAELWAEDWAVNTTESAKTAFVTYHKKLIQECVDKYKRK